MVYTCIHTYLHPEISNEAGFGHRQLRLVTYATSISLLIYLHTTKRSLNTVVTKDTFLISFLHYIVILCSLNLLVQNSTNFSLYTVLNNSRSLFSAVKLLMYIIASPCSIRLKLTIQNINISKIIRQLTIKQVNQCQCFSPISSYKRAYERISYIT